MMSRYSILVVPAALLVLTAGCTDSSATGVAPMLGAVPVGVELSGAPGVPLEGLPRVTIHATSGGVVAEWEVATSGCALAEARGERADNVIAIWITFTGNPLANCAPQPVGYRYVATIRGLAAGTYLVRLIDAPLREPARVAGQSFVSVTPGD